tara:strand:- start:216 stop:2003 length:1788 start_codon:yes stop_codon:yes gene_type:complete
MATRYNPYAMDANLSAGISNLTRALIGSAQDDAAIARGKASMAQAGASNALTRLRNEQTRGEANKNKFFNSYTGGLDKALGDANIVKSLFGNFGLPESEYVEKDVAFDDPLVTPKEGVSPGLAQAFYGSLDKPVPFKGNVPIEYNPEAMKGLVRTLFGNTLANPQQASEMGINLQEMGMNKIARDLILNSDQSATAMAKALLGDPSGKYDEAGSARYEVDEKNKTEIEKQKLKGKTDVKVAEIGAETDQIIAKGNFSNKIDLKKLDLKSRELIEAKRLEAENIYKRWEANELNKTNLKINDEKLALEEKIEKLKLQASKANNREKLRLEEKMKKLEIESKEKVEKMKNLTVRWKFRNQPITATFKPGEKIIWDPVTGARLGYEPNEDGLYITDGGRDPNKLRVTIGKKDVWIPKEDAEALNVTQNEKGQYIIKGAGYPEDQKKEQDVVEGFNDTFSEDFMMSLPEDIGKELAENRASVLMHIRSMAFKELKNKMKRDIPYDEAYADISAKYFTGVTEIGGGTFSTGEYVPNFIIDKAVNYALKPEMTMENWNKAVAQMRQDLRKDFKYPPETIEEILAHIKEKVREESALRAVRQ